MIAFETYSSKIFHFANVIYIAFNNNATNTPVYAKRTNQQQSVSHFNVIHISTTNSFANHFGKEIDKLAYVDYVGRLFPNTF